jgi:hypothetical protein
MEIATRAAGDIIAGDCISGAPDIQAIQAEEA